MSYKLRVTSPFGQLQVKNLVVNLISFANTLIDLFSNQYQASAVFGHYRPAVFGSQHTYRTVWFYDC